MLQNTDFIDLEKRKKLNEQGYWEIPDNLDTSEFDFTWRPFMYERPFIHQFGTQWQKTGGPRFIVPESEGIKYQNFQHAIKLPDENSRNWRPLVVNAEIDCSWHPDETDPPYIYVFGNQWYDAEIMPTFQYRVKGATEKKYINNLKAILQPNKNNYIIPDDIDDSQFDYSWCPNPHEPNMDWQFGTQWQKTGGPKYVVKNSLGTKFVDFQKVIKLPNEENRNWRPLHTNINFDYSWHPDETDPPYIYVFGNQWYDAEIMPTMMYRVKGATEKKYINNVKATLLPNQENRSWRPLKSNLIIDYSWVPNPFDPPYIYVFGNQWFTGEEMPTAQYRVKGATNYKFMNMDIVKFRIDTVPCMDSLFDALIESQTETDYIQLGSVDLDHVKFMPKPDSNIHIIDNSYAIVPKEAKSYLYDKLQDYPYVKYHDSGYKNKPLDIIFLSNGEKGAEENYEHLLSLVKDLPNNIIGIKGVKGRVASQHEAAKLASTPWYFLINGKLRVNEKFDFSWQPNRTCKARHYIFRATNSVNNLDYGHMAIVANNKRLTLQTKGLGLDFTLESPHEVVNIHSGVGIFNTSKWDTWRTAFREVIKLKHNVETINDSASKERLNVWLTIANGDYAEYALKGSQDAVNYYNEVSGDFDKLKLSYDWEWLRTKFDSYRP